MRVLQTANLSVWLFPMAVPLPPDHAESKTRALRGRMGSSPMAGNICPPTRSTQPWMGAKSTRIWCAHVVRLIALLSFSPRCFGEGIHFTGQGETMPTHLCKRKAASFNLFESFLYIKGLAIRAIPDIIGVDNCGGFDKDLYERTIHGREGKVMVWAAAKKQKPQKQNEGCADDTHLFIPPSSTLSSPQVEDDLKKPNQG